MPLLRYFATIGTLLMALLLLLDFVLAPGKPNQSKHPIARVDTAVGQPRMTSGSAPSSPTEVVPSAPVSASRNQPAETTTADSVQPAFQADPRSDARPKPRSKTKQKRAKDRKEDMVKRPHGDGSAYGYSRQNLAPQSSPEGTMGPH